MAGKDRENEITIRGKYLRAASHTRRSVLSRSLFIVHCSLLILLFLSCRSAPKVAEPAFMEADSVPLESGAMIYLIADVKEARPLINLLPIKELQDSQTKQMLERTDFLAAALFPKESGRNFQLAAWGNYPSSGADVAFGMNKEWNKLQAASGYSYWYSEANGLSISLNPRQAFAASSLSDQPVEPVTAPPGVKMPEGFAEFRIAADSPAEGTSAEGSPVAGNPAAGRPSPLSCWLDEGSSVINQILNSSGLPIRFPVQELFIAFFPAGEGRYQAAIRMRLESVSQARGMASLLSRANNFIFGEYGINSLLTAVFFANPPVQNERDIDIKSAPLKENEISLLLQMFLLYWK